MSEQTEMNIKLDQGAPESRDERTPPRRNQTEIARNLEQPFTIQELKQATGLSKSGAASQVRRWQYAGWLHHSNYGQYTRTAQFGIPKERRKQKPEGQRLTSRGNVATFEQACDMPNCQFIGYGSTEKHAMRSVGRHKSMVHGVKKVYIPVGLRAKMGLGVHTKYAIPQSNGAVPAPAAVGPNSNGTTPVFEPRDEIKFCPGCGLNLEMHLRAYRIARKHSGT